MPKVRISNGEGYGGKGFPDKSLQEGVRAVQGDRIRAECPSCKRPKLIEYKSTYAPTILRRFCNNCGYTQVLKDGEEVL